MKPSFQHILIFWKNWQVLPEVQNTFWKIGDHGEGDFCVSGVWLFLWCMKRNDILDEHYARIWKPFSSFYCEKNFIVLTFYAYSLQSVFLKKGKFRIPKTKNQTTVTYHLYDIWKIKASGYFSGWSSTCSTEPCSFSDHLYFMTACFSQCEA